MDSQWKINSNFSGNGKKMHIFSKTLKKEPVPVLDWKTGSPVFSGSVQEPVFRFLTEAKNQFFGLTVSGSPSLLRDVIEEFRDRT